MIDSVNMVVIIIDFLKFIIKVLINKFIDWVRINILVMFIMSIKMK